MKRVLGAAALVAVSLIVAPVPPADAGLPVIYLTFDDGPSRDDVTEDLLGVLEQHDAEATFFLVGHNVSQRPELVNDILANGHAIGNHTFDHPSLTSTSDTGILSQLQRTQDEITNAGGHQLTCFRPPFGYTSPRVATLASSVGLLEQLWDIDTRDYESDSSTQEILDVLETAQGGDIVLLHDGWHQQDETLAAVDAYLSEHSDEFSFRALPGCRPRPNNHTEIPPPPPLTTQSLAAQTWPAMSSAIPDEPRFRIERLYQSVFGRPSDPSGLRYWMDIESSHGMAPIIDAFQASPEFNLRYGNGSTEDFLRALYRNSLGRNPDDGGVHYWADQLSAGLDRTFVVTFFAESAELRESFPRSRLSRQTDMIGVGLSGQTVPLSHAYRLWELEVAHGQDTSVRALLDALDVDDSEHHEALVLLGRRNGRIDLVIVAALERYDDVRASGQSTERAFLEATRFLES